MEKKYNKIEDLKYWFNKFFECPNPSCKKLYDSKLEALSCCQKSCKIVWECPRCNKISYDVPKDCGCFEFED